MNPPTCKDIQQILPLVAVGGCETTQLEEVLEHLGGCDACLARLEEERWLMEMASAHIPSWELASFAQGLPSETLPREIIVDHVTVCRSCRDEISLAMSDRIPDFRIEKQRRFSHRAARVWKLARAAAAAGLIIALTYLSSRQSVQNKSLALEGLPGSVEIARIDFEASSQGQVQIAPIPLFDNGFESGETVRWSELNDHKQTEFELDRSDKN